MANRIIKTLLKRKHNRVR